MHAILLSQDLLKHRGLSFEAAVTYSDALYIAESAIAICGSEYALVCATSALLLLVAVNATLPTRKVTSKRNYSANFFLKEVT